jgi:RNA polymerase sigma-70 factor (ECF subfamily)
MCATLQALTGMGRTGKLRVEETGMASGNYKTMSDEALMAAYYACDDAALEELHRRYYLRLVAYLSRFVSPEDAEDLAEETFYRVARTKATGKSKFDPSKARFTTWLYNIANNLLKDYRRRQRGEVEVEAEEVEEKEPAIEQIPSEAPKPEELQEAQEFSDPVHECLAELSDAHREVLLLDIQGFELPEIAETLGIPYGTAGSRLSIARSRMRACLERKGYQFIPRGSELPPGTRIVMRFQDELLVYVGGASQE